uniref:2-oxoacid:ferredoxin oxidoreductase subunit gamma n=1 Tax=candidate division WOR-3 bacterium TaxID=2052148 RepID=A0A7C4YI30_UNCW3
MKYELRFVGSGGQGVILAGLIFSEAAGIDEKLNVVQTQLYGAATRGEISKSEVIVSDQKINYIKVRNADILLALNQESFNAYNGNVKENGIILIDSFYVKDYNKDDKRIIALPLSETAIRVTNREVTTNIVSLGVITILSRIIKKESMKNAVLRRIPKGTEEMNIAALEEGFKLGEGVRW